MSVHRPLTELTGVNSILVGLIRENRNTQLLRLCKMHVMDEITKIYSSLL